MKNKKSLWVFPDHFLTIRLKGATIEEVVQTRFKRNLLIILGMDVILLISVVIVYRSLKKELELVEMKTDFVSNVSHELRTPLSLIRMFAETLEMGRVKSEEKKIDYYKIIIGETERLTRLINNLLNFSRMDGNKRVFNFTQVNINQKILSALNVFQFQLKSNNFEVVTDLDEYLSFVKGDPEAIEEAVMNLLENAIKYSTVQKIIKIKTGKSDGYIFVEIEDHGIGIAKENHGKVFEKFYRVSSGLVHNTKGSGLGLSIIQNIMNVHGGKIELISELGKGSTFRLLFPVEKN